MIGKYFSDHILEEITKICKDAEEEFCGLVVLKDGNQILYPAKNIAPNPKTDFAVDPDVYVKARLDGNIIAAYHNHFRDEQSGGLSPTDIARCKRFKVPYLLYHNIFNCWDYYDPFAPNPHPLDREFNPKDLNSYLGWCWEYNRSDCATLLLSFFKGFLGIELKDYPRPKTLKDLEKHDLYSYNLNLEGFKRIDKDSFQPYDVVLMALLVDAPHHVGIILEDGSMLHLYDESNPSEITGYKGSLWEDATVSRWRHKSLMDSISLNQVCSI